jgi:hypothetical protein
MTRPARAPSPRYAAIPRAITQLFVAAGLLALPACSSHSTRPAAPTNERATLSTASGGRGGPTAQRYPLAIGNRWMHRIHNSTWFEYVDGHVEPIYELTVEFEQMIRRTGVVDGRRYFYQTGRDPVLGEAGPHAFQGLRQQPDGLFRSNAIREPERPAESATAVLAPGLESEVARRVLARGLPVALAPAAAELIRRGVGRCTFGFEPGPSIPSETGETQLLRYPMQPGVGWVARETPRETRRVIRRERVHLPIGDQMGWRVRIRDAADEPWDVTDFWYSDLGHLRTFVHEETVYRDNDGVLLGHLVEETEAVLEEIHLEGDAALQADLPTGEEAGPRPTEQEPASPRHR